MPFLTLKWTTKCWISYNQMHGSSKFSFLKGKNIKRWGF
uniref:Uncharacterized protein n=1 Tax=Rhizophora mucronata TaxID=61149 RepID=A0A2P2P0H1_RHIMU